MRKPLTPMMLDDDCMAIVNHLNNLRLTHKRRRQTTVPNALQWMAYAGAAAASGREWLTRISENEARSSPEED